MHGNNTHLYDQDIARWGQATAVDKDLVVQIGSSDDTRPIEIPHFLAAQHLRPLVLHHLRARCRPSPAGSGALVARGVVLFPGAGVLFPLQHFTVAPEVFQERRTDD